MAPEKPNSWWWVMTRRAALLGRGMCCARTRSRNTCQRSERQQERWPRSSVMAVGCRRGRRPYRESVLPLGPATWMYVGRHSGSSRITGRYAAWDPFHDGLRRIVITSHHRLGCECDMATSHPRPPPKQIPGGGMQWHCFISARGSE